MQRKPLLCNILLKSQSSTENTLNLEHFQIPQHPAPTSPLFLQQYSTPNNSLVLWNETHTKNPHRPPHAEFHPGQTISIGLCLGLFITCQGICSGQLQDSRYTWNSLLNDFFERSTLFRYSSYESSIQGKTSALLALLRFFVLSWLVRALFRSA
ncbi:hypothetical protein N7G274_010222 [Stereocaulon virgatum]|uniref:Uncharacterized protein n=1 Tax=Stereocaulon virgatum TaxID=373712 RepID=A0ABR3ZWH4_9LECA